MRVSTPAMPPPLYHCTQSSLQATPLPRTATPYRDQRSKSTLAKLVARLALTSTLKLVKQLVPCEYHQFIGMFRKTNTQSLPPRRQYDFRVELVPGALPQASRIIPLWTTEHQALDSFFKRGWQMVPSNGQPPHGLPQYCSREKRWYLEALF
jgi:hypothetical protein